MARMAEDDTPQSSHIVPSSLSMFEEAIATYSLLFEKASTKLVNLHEILAKESRIWPDQCKRIRGFLYEMEKPVHKLYTLLENASQLPPGIVSLRYPLLMTLQNTEEQIKKLIPMLAEFTRPNLLSTKIKEKKRKEVLRCFEGLERNYTNLRMYAQDFLDQIHIQAGWYDQISLDQKRSLLLQNANSNEKLGWEASEEGRKEEALDYFKRALVLIRKVGEPQREASILNNLGRMYSVLGCKDDACRHLEMALVLVEENADRENEIFILNNLGLVYADIGNYAQAKGVLQRALTLCQERKDIEGECRINNTLGIIHNL